MTIEVNKTNISNNPYLTNDNVKNGTKSEPISIPLGKNNSTGKPETNEIKTNEYAQKLELIMKTQKFESMASLIKFGIDRIDSNFGKLSAAEQYNKLLAYFQLTEEELVANAERAEQSENSQQTTDNDEFTYYNHNAFSKLSKEEKIETLSLELAKNEFLYGDENAQKTLEQWNALTDEQKNQLIQNAKTDILKNSKNNDNNDKALDFKMELIQASNFNKRSYSKLPKDNKLALIDFAQEYLAGIYPDETIRDNLSETQKHSIEERQEVSNIVIAECKKLGIADFSENTTLTPSELKECLEKIKAKNGKDVLTLNIDYLKDLQDKGVPLSEHQREKLDFCTNLKSGLDAVGETPAKNYGRLDAIKNSGFGEELTNASSSVEQIKVYNQYIEKNFGDLPPEDFAKAIGELTNEIMNNEDDPNAKITGSLLYAKVLKSATPEQKEALARLNDLNSLVNNTVHINEHSGASAKTVAKTQEDNKSYKLAAQRIERSNDEIAHATSEIDSSSRSEDVQRAHKNRIRTVQDVAYQLDMSMNVAHLSNLNIRKEFSVEDYQLDEEIQDVIHAELIKDKDVAIYANQNGHLNLYAKSKQPAICKVTKERFEEPDFTPEEAVEQLNILSDQIQYCDKDNQLAMHNEIMTSQYAEVQEHAAGNIKYYDPSVQADAINTVYATGNQNAIEAAIVNLAEGNYANGVQEQVLGNTLNTAFNTENSEKIEELRQKIVSGETLSPQEWNSLTPKQKSEYQAAYFKNLTPAKQLKLLANISDPSLKKSIYKRIANQDKQMLENLIASDADTAKFIYDMGIANEMVIGICEQKASSEIKFATLLNNIKHSEDFILKDNPPTAKTIDYASIPFTTHEKFDIFKKNADGHLLA